MRMVTTISLSLALLIMSATAWAKEAQPADHLPAAKTRHAKTAAAPSSDARHRPSNRHADRQADRRTGRQANRRATARDERPRGQNSGRATELPPPDRLIGPALRVIGPREVGRAAWYGGRHLGERTASGERLDAIHATAAHRSLPLHSLVRVTNLANGRSAVATINDRGPVSRSLLIDLSPRVADELDMKRAGIARVAIEPVTQTAAAH